MRVWMKAEPSGPLKSRAEGDSLRCTLKVAAWERSDAPPEDPGETVALVIGTAGSGGAEIRVQYEEADYEEHKRSLVVQRAVKEAMKRVQLELQNHLGS
ncbi:hypothetical protein [Paenibacillus mucilaginosus]|uniref:Uncharacterized protein n=3 Tax=Paenibacillus mucilaginosus TaxID=61624 RepID=H6NJ50_9BACL|nr:hypothetical protein [Paenibacillus mucilaginosus]AFC28812.1 hypothetical protein PM3016_1908 [Paenibacillus mucilaginosus 3016]MCG7215767.1 hypothetical protein [Paenibacillus mucilaginosus]